MPTSKPQSQPQPISADGFRGVATRMADGFGFFEDGPFSYVLLSMVNYRVDILLRERSETFCHAIERQDGDARVAVNGQLFGPRNLMMGLGGVVDPMEVEGEGQLRVGGTLREENSVAGKTRFYFGRNRAANVYEVKAGNPSSSTHEGMGGLGALIMTRADGTAVPMGVGNLYSTSRDTNDPPPFSDETDARWLECTQRNSLHFADFMKTEQGTAYGALAASHSQRLLAFIFAKPEDGNDLATLRDKLLDAGFDCACFTDGASSATFAVDRHFLQRPTSFRDNSIEAGFVGLLVSARRTRVRVTFRSIDVLDPGVDVGDEAIWSIVATVRNSPIAPPSEFTVTFGTVIDLIDLGWTGVADLKDDDLLEFALVIDNVTPATLSGVAPASIPPTRDSARLDSTPAWGEGSWSQEKGEFYRIHYTIEVLPP